MIPAKTLKTVEFDKILSSVTSFAVLDRTKREITEFQPTTDLVSACSLLDKTEEAFKLLYVYSVGGVYYFKDISEELERVDRGGTLNNAELLAVAENLKSARIMKRAVSSVKDETITAIPEICARLYENSELEKEIISKIISEDEVSDNASPRLYSIRRSIRELNAKIRDKLNSFVRGGNNKYLQDQVVTVRQDRYVIPVKSEYRSQIKGFIHDQSSSGATVFIEPEQVMEYNNELKKAKFDESEEIYRILAELSSKVSFCSDALRYNAENICEVDNFFARAAYSFTEKCVKPVLNDKGYANVIRGRHPLIRKDKVVPVSVSLGKDYRYMLVTGPNTGGKTVTLKLLGLFSVMAASGIFVPAAEGTELSVFDGIFCDIGDEQSIEQNLSTFSSHIKNVIEIIGGLSGKSLVLLDELGAGTDPEEGSALALAIIEKLIASGSCGIVTTHYSKLKEFATENPNIVNASMEFDAVTLKPLYKLNIGVPGSSNALEIAKTLGLPEDIIDRAVANLSEEKVSFERVLKKAEEGRRETERLAEQLELIKKEKEAELKEIAENKEKIVKEREKIYSNAKQETKRIVAEKLSEAEEIIDELKGILKKAGLESREAIRAAELKNRLKNSRYLEAENDLEPIDLVKTKTTDLKIGSKVYVKSLGAYGKLLSVKENKNEAEILIGDIRSKIKLSDLYNQEEEKSQQKSKIKISRTAAYGTAETRLNVIGKTSLEAVDEVKRFIDSAVVNNLEEVTIIHGVGEGILLKAIRDYLKTDKNVKEFRRGRYGEGENGVTVVRLK